MANTVHGPYAPTAWATNVPVSVPHANNWETQAGVALHSLNPDLVASACVLSGVACVKDAATATQLNVTSGEAYLIMSDGTLARIDVAASTAGQFVTTGNISTTMYLDLNPDGTWSFATTHSAQAHALPICQVTTDGSANIATVSDARVMLAQLLSGAAHPSVAQPGGAQLPAPLAVLTTQSAALAASVVGGVTFGQVGSLAGSFDGAALLNGTTGYLTMPTTGLPTGNNPWSISARFKTSFSGGSQVIAFAGSASTKSAMWVYLDSTGHVILDLFSSSLASSAGGYNNGAWHSVLVTWDGTTGTIFVDGASVGSSATIGPDNISYTYGLIGVYNNSGYTAFFNGTLDEVAVFGAALTSGNASALHSAASSATSDSYASTLLALAPLRYYRLGDASGAGSAACSISATSKTLLDAAGNITAPAALTTVGNVTAGGTLAAASLTSLGGQATAGSFGAPVIVAQIVDYNMTTNALLNILVYAVTTTGHYRVSATVTPQNATSPQGVSCLVHWTDPHTNTTNGEPFVTLNSGVVTALSGSNNLPTTGGIAYPLMPLVVHAKAGANLTVSYNDPGGTPNDFISAFIERVH